MKKALLLSVLFLTGCAGNETLDASSKRSDGIMRATWYQDGKRTANGERFNPNGMTAAHRNLPFGTRLHLTHGGRSAIVRINDRGPFVRGKQLDLARGAARALGCSGVCTVEYRVVGR